MIDEIQVRNVALIKEASLAPSRGLTVLTGETGAGKTALLSALKLLMGARADKDQVREGSEGLEVSGRFFGVGADAAAGADSSEADLVAVRKLGVDGRSRATIDGRMASVHELAETIAPSIDLCGQFEHQQLMKPATHVDMLDAWAGGEVASAREAYAQAFGAARAAQAEYDRVVAASDTSSAKLDEARFVLRQIDEVDPQPGEYEELVVALERAEHAEALVAATAGAHEALAGDEGALDRLGSAAGLLESVARHDEELGKLAQSLREAAYVLEDVAAEARDYRDGIEFDAEVLAEQQARVAAMQGLMRKYGPRMEDVLAKRDEAAETVSLIDDSAVRRKAAAAELARAEETLASAADALDAARAAAAPRFCVAVTAQMERLEMGSAQLECAIERADRAAWSIKGPSTVEFMYRPGRSMTARPLARIASGGEVSRVMLAIKVVLGSIDCVDTLVFDEVDAGVGGATAVALAEVIADLAKTHQVLVVTHLASVAVRADTHYVVRRDTVLDVPETQIALLDGEARVEEIARMLSGDSSETALAHAREMLAR